MADPISFSVEEMEQRRRRTSAARKASIVRPPSPPKIESESLAVINEIFNPTYKKPVTKGPYRAPDEVSADDFEAMKELDISKVAELKEVFLLLDLDSDGLISKDDLRFTFTALGTDTPDEQIEEMLKEAKDPLDYEAFIELMSHRTVELDPEDVLLEAWSKWDDYGTGKIEEKNCTDFIEIFPFLRVPVIENSTNPDYVICNRTTATSANVSALASSTTSVATPTLATKRTAVTKPTPPTTVEAKQKILPVNANASSMATLASKKSTMMVMSSVANYAHSTVMAANNSVGGAVGDLRSNEFIYSSGKILGIRVRFKQQQQQQQREKSLQAVGDVHALESVLPSITAEYRFLKKEHFQNDGRLIPGSFCDYYFFADANEKPESFEIWQYFHSPRFPAKYPAHIKCAYKFIGSCNMDKLTIFDSESANMNAVIDVICEVLPSRRIISSGPDLLIEFNASSNITTKGFRGKFKFIRNEIEYQTTPAILSQPTTGKCNARQ